MEQESGLESSAVQLVHLRKRMVYLGFENRKWQAQDRSTWVSRWIGRHTWVSWWIGRQAGVGHLSSEDKVQRKPIVGQSSADDIVVWNHGVSVSCPSRYKGQAREWEFHPFLGLLCLISSWAWFPESDFNTPCVSTVSIHLNT